MKTVSMTTFLDFVAKLGTQRVRIVRDQLARDYDPKTDFYKRLRASVIEMFKRGENDPVASQGARVSYQQAQAEEFPSGNRRHRGILLRHERRHRLV